ncbi:hypothetical protein ABZ825_29900 [Streptomyces tauricus]|uniref:hypothetical protein n=1 Tax=Streptomyces tauricus TaxID=68274 RepID=UPI0033F981B7
MKYKIAAIGASAVALVAMASAPASATTWGLQCAVTGASGYVNYNVTSSTRIDLTIGVRDTSSDGHHARARLLTKNNSGEIHYWAWRKDTDGANNGTINADTFASDSNGITDVGVQVGNYEGDEPLDLCSDWVQRDIILG